MKVKQVVHITDVDKLMKGDYSTCFTLFETPSKVSGWIVLPNIVEIDVDLDVNDLRLKAIQATEEEMHKLREETTRKLEKLEERKQQLLALTHEPGEPSENRKQETEDQ